MAITLITGVPGTGKTVYAMSMIVQLVKTGRPLYVHGIPNLTIPHTPVICNSLTCDTCPPPPLLPQKPETIGLDARSDQKQQYNIDLENYEIKLKQYQSELDIYKKQLQGDQWQDWAPDGALILFDEVQHIHRPRSSTSKVPISISAYETHRHKGLDFIILSQSPLLFDSNLQRLVGRHIHLRSTWLTRYQYEFPECKTSLGTLSGAVKSKYKLDKRVYPLFKSASLHTKQEKKVPVAVYLLIVLFFVFLFIAYRVNASIFSKNEISIDNNKQSFTELNISNNQILDIDIEKNYDLIDISRFSYSGISLEQINDLPGQCSIYSKKSIRCYFPPHHKNLFNNSVCINNNCFSLLKIIT